MAVAVISSQIPPHAADCLRKYGYHLIVLPPHPSLPAPVASHPDMLLFFSSHICYTFSSYAELAQKELRMLQQLTGIELRLIGKEPGNRYPEDILLNAAQVGNRLFCLSGQIAQELTHIPDLKIVNVRQGYAKCSILPLSDRALITSDPSISLAAESEGMEVLRIRSGFIDLPGYDTGLIGGCASYAPYSGNSNLFFCGEPALHPDGNAILQFCSRHGRTTVSLCAEPLTDVGTIFLMN